MATAADIMRPKKGLLYVEKSNTHIIGVIMTEEDRIEVKKLIDGSVVEERVY